MNEARGDWLETVLKNRVFKFRTILRALIDRGTFSPSAPSPWP